MDGKIARPFPPPALNALTVDDAMAVACKEGVNGFIEKHQISATAIPVSDLLEFANKGERDYILMAAGLAGYGNGDGNGYGDGYGYGNGYGDGYGYGYGDGNGYGDGDGNGYGDGDGYGYGDGEEP